MKTNRIMHYEIKSSIQIFSYSEQTLLEERCDSNNPGLAQFHFTYSLSTDIKSQKISYKTRENYMEITIWSEMFL